MRKRRSFARLVEQEELRELRKTAPYGEMCQDPRACAGKGSCPRDPTCGD